MKRSIATVPLLLVALALVGCGPTPPPGGGPVDPRPTPTGSPTPIPVPTSTLPPDEADPLGAVTRILLETERLSFCDDDTCGIDGFRYDDDPDVAIAKLTAVFGIDPVAESYEGYDSSTSYTYRWGSDFLLYFSTGDSPAIDHLVRVQVHTPAVEGVAIETQHGVRVGTSMAEARDLADRTDETGGEVGTIYQAHFDVVEIDENNWTAIVAFGTDASGPVTELVGPITTGRLAGY